MAQALLPESSVGLYQGEEESSSSGGGGSGAAVPVGNTQAGLDAPPVPPELAVEIYGHLAEPVSGASASEIEASAAAKKQAIEAAAQGQAAKVEEQAKTQRAAAVPPAAAAVAAKEPTVAAEPPTKDGLLAELQASLDKELEELESDKTQALADLDARIATQEARVSGALVGDDFGADAEKDVRAASDTQKSALDKQGALAEAERMKRAAEKSKTDTETANKKAADVEIKAESDAALCIAEGTLAVARLSIEFAGKIVAEQSKMEAINAQVQAGEGGNVWDRVSQMNQCVQRVAQLGQDREAAIGNAQKTAADKAKGIRDQAKLEAGRIREDAAAAATKATGAAQSAGDKAEGAAAGKVDKQRTAGTDKIKAEAEGTRAQQQEKVDATLAELKKQREALVTRLDAQIAQKKQGIETKIAGLTKQINGAGDNPARLGQLAASVKTTTGQIDKASDELATAAKAQVDALDRQLTQQATAAVATMNAQAKMAQARIDADARAAKAALERAGKDASRELAADEKKADAQFDADAAKISDDLAKSIDRRQQKLHKQVDAAHKEIAEQGMTPAARAVHKAGAAGGPAIVAALATVPAEDREAAINELPTEKARAEAREQLKLAARTDALKAAAADGGSFGDALADLDFDQRNQVLAASGLDAKKLEGWKGLTDGETQDAVQKLIKAQSGEKPDPKAIKDAFDKMSPEQQKEAAAAYEKETHHKLEQDVPAEMVPPGALGDEAKKQLGDDMKALGILQNLSGNAEIDTAHLREAMQIMSPENRALAVQGLLPGDKALGEMLLKAQQDADALKEAKGNPEAIDKVLAGKSPAERQNAIMASGLDDEIDDKYKRLSAEEAAAAVKSLQTVGKDGKPDPAAVEAAMLGLDPAARKQIAEAFESETHQKLEDAIPRELLPNCVLSPKAAADKLAAEIKAAGDAAGPALTRQWLESLPEDQRAAAMAELPEEQREGAQLCVMAGDKAEALGKIAPVDKDLDPSKPEDKEKIAEQQKAHDEAVAAVFEDKSPAERNAIIREAALRDPPMSFGPEYTALSGDETMAAAKALQDAHGDPAKIKAAYAGMTPEQAKQVAVEFESVTGKTPEEALPKGSLPANAVVPAKQEDAAAYADIVKIADEKERAAAMAKLPPEQRKVVGLMVENSEDVEDLQAATAGGRIDEDKIDLLLAGRSVDERRAIIAAAGLTNDANVKKYTELSDDEKAAMAMRLRAANIGGVVDRDTVNETMGHLDADQQQQVKREFKDQTGERIGDAFARAGAEDALPAALREKPVDPKKVGDAAKQLFAAMDGSGTDEDKILNALRGKSPREIEAICKEYAANNPGHSLMADLEEDLDDDPEALAAAKAMMSDDPVAAAKASLEYAARGHELDGTDEQLMKDTLEAITDPEDRRRLEQEWLKSHPGESLQGMLNDELGETDFKEADALRTGNIGRARAVRAYDALDGGNDLKKLREQLEALPDKKSRDQFMKDYKEVAKEMGEPDLMCDLDTRMRMDLDPKEYDVAGKLAKGDVVGAYAAGIDLAADNGFWGGTDENAMFDTYEKPPASWHGSAAEWRKRVTKVHDDHAVATGGMKVDELAEDELSPMDYERFKMDKADGKMTDTFRIKYAASAGGEDADMLNVLKNPDGTLKTKKQIAELEAQWRLDNPDLPPLSTFIDDETGGSVAFDAQDALKGEPESQQEKLQRMRERQEFESSGLLKGFANMFSQSDEMMEAQLRLAEAANDVVNDPNASEADKQKAQEQFAQSYRSMDANVDQHRTAMTQVANTLSQVMKYASILTPLGPLMMSTTLNKKLLLGDQMAWKDVGQDLAVEGAQGIVMAAVTIATMGTGTGPALAAMEGAMVGAEAALEGGALAMEAMAEAALVGGGEALATAAAEGTLNGLVQVTVQGGKSLLTTVVEQGFSNVLGSIPADIQAMMKDQKGFGDFLSGVVTNFGMGALSGVLGHGLDSLNLKGMLGKIAQQGLNIADNTLQQGLMSMMEGRDFDLAELGLGMAALAHGHIQGMIQSPLMEKMAKRLGINTEPHVTVQHHGGEEPAARRPAVADETPAPHPAVVDETPAPHPAVVDETPAPRPAAVDETPAPRPAVVDETPAPRPVALDETPAPRPAAVDETPAPRPSAETEGDGLRVAKPEDARDAASKLYDMNKALEKEKNEFYTPGSTDEPEHYYKHGDLNAVEESMRQFADGDQNAQNGKCSVSCDTWQKRLAEQGMYVPIMDHDGHRWMAAGDLIIDPTFGQFFKGEMTELPNGKTQYEPFIGTLEEMKVRVQEAIDAGHMPGVEPGTDAGEVIAKNWGVSQGKEGLELSKDVKPFAKAPVEAPEGYQHPAARPAEDAGTTPPAEDEQPRLRVEVPEQPKLRVAEPEKERVRIATDEDGARTRAAEDEARALEEAGEPGEPRRQRVEAKSPSPVDAEARTLRPGELDAMADTERPGHGDVIGYTPWGAEVRRGEEAPGRWRDHDGNWHASDGSELESRDEAIVRTARSNMVTSEQGRAALAYLDGEGSDTKITLTPDEGSYRQGQRINLDPNQTSDQMAETGVHEVHHAKTFDEDVRAGDMTKPEYVRAALRNEAEAVANQAEHVRAKGQEGGTEKQHDLMFHDELKGFELGQPGGGAATDYLAYHDEAMRQLRDLDLGLPEETLRNMARDEAIDRLTDDFGKIKPSTSYDKQGNLKPGAPPTYQDHYELEYERLKPADAEADTVRSPAPCNDETGQPLRGLPAAPDDGQLGRLEPEERNRHDELMARWGSLGPDELAELAVARDKMGMKGGPQTPAHKLERWEDYQERCWKEGREPKKWETWSRVYDNNMENGRGAPMRAEEELRRLTGGENRIIEVPGFGSRQIDCYIERDGKRTAIQHKTGYEALSTDPHVGPFSDPDKRARYEKRKQAGLPERQRSQLANAEAIARDRRLVGAGIEVIWVLEQGASKALIAELEAAGITVKLGTSYLDDLRRQNQAECAGAVDDEDVGAGGSATSTAEANDSAAGETATRVEPMRYRIAPAPSEADASAGTDEEAELERQAELEAEEETNRLLLQRTSVYEPYAD